MALRLFRLAAEQEDIGAQTKLGTMYYLGKGVPQIMSKHISGSTSLDQMGIRMASSFVML